jgi:hypothetical protein
VDTVTSTLIFQEKLSRFYSNSLNFIKLSSHYFKEFFKTWCVLRGSKKLKQITHENKVSVSSPEKGTRNSGSANPGNWGSVVF